MAAVGGHAKIISLLIGAGAEREAKGRDGVSGYMGTDGGMS